MEVMKILWEYGKATSSQIVERLTETTEWKPKTIQTLITRLVNKGAVGAEKINNKSFVYYPIVSEEQYKSYANKSFLQKMVLLALCLQVLLKNKNFLEKIWNS